MNNTRGWYRLGVVLSTAWMLMMSAVAGYEYFLAQPSDKLWFVTHVEAPTLVNDQLTQKKLQEEWDKAAPLTPEEAREFESRLRAERKADSARTPPFVRPAQHVLNSVSFLIVIFVPLGVLWLLVPLVAFAVSWVRAGFKS